MWKKQDPSGCPLSAESPSEFSKQALFLVPMTFGHCTTLLTQMHFFFLPKHLCPQGSWHFHTACCNDGQWVDLVLSKRMTLSIAALMDHRQPSALLTCAARAINTINGSKLNTTIMGWNTC